jgi:hypothetical protein
MFYVNIKIIEKRGKTMRRPGVHGKPRKHDKLKQHVQQPSLKKRVQQPLSKKHGKLKKHVQQTSPPH